MAQTGAGLKEMGRRYLDGIVSAEVFLVHAAFAASRLRREGDGRADTLLCLLHAAETGDYVAISISAWMQLEIDDI